MNSLVDSLRQMADDKALPIGDAWNALDEAADRIDELERERLSICNLCEALQDSPRSFLQQMTAWAARVRTANTSVMGGGTPYPGRSVGQGVTHG